MPPISHSEWTTLSQFPLTEWSLPILSRQILRPRTPSSSEDSKNWLAPKSIRVLIQSYPRWSRMSINRRQAICMFETRKEILSKCSRILPHKAVKARSKHARINLIWVRQPLLLLHASRNLPPRWSTLRGSPIRRSSQSRCKLKNRSKTLENRLRRCSSQMS